ncbi:SPOR domain-containing protein [Curvibacter sp. APW13]|uniref:SPOR domain-containing protein n=1 Tax=Curvibacter sp. APW13 TaxID=3077236 RepID=UPI0028DD9D8B|nr:SPOR domain-containing protein [Curvibacter sp. APW13]MDT8990899.1 SPOR domain-containing protein [Curvibacter sp. APW13]
MAFFKFRKGGEDAPAAPTAAESVQALRKRARHRLIGASVLVLAGVIGFPLLFDNQPRPIAVDIPIDIPDKNKVKPLGNLPVAPAPVQSGAVGDETAPPPLTTPAPAVAEAQPNPAPAPAPAAVAQVAPKEEIIAPAKPAPAPVAAKPEPKPEPKIEAKAEPKPTPAPVAKPAADAAKAQALLEGKEPAKAEPKPAPKPEAKAEAKHDAKADAGKGRFVVQVGSFTDMAKAREARLKMEKAGFKTYTQEVQLKEGKRLRVRIGPFETRATAEKAAEKAKKLELSGAILEL